MKFWSASIFVLPLCGLVYALHPPAPFPKRETDLAKLAVPAVFGQATLEVPLPDGSRADALTEDFAVEVDWPEKWAEAPSQAVWYGMLTNKQPAVLLLLRGGATEKVHVARCAALCGRFHVELYFWRLDPNDPSGGRVVPPGLVPGPVHGPGALAPIAP